MKREFLTIFFLIFTAFISCQKEVKNTEPVRLQGAVFGTTYSIIYYDVKTNFDTEIQQLFADINQSLSTYIPTSDISKINRGEKGIKVDAYYKEVFAKSARIFKETDGYFDPTVGNLVNV